MLIVKIGNIFDSTSDVLVNTVNCVGVMGKGVAKTFKQKYPEMFAQYKNMCDNNQLITGKLYPYYEGGEVKVLNFPTKEHWRSSSKLSYIEDGLDWFVEKYEELGIKSIAFPPLGCGNGGLEWSTVGPLMYKKLKDLPIDIEVYAPYGTTTKELSDEFLSSYDHTSNTQGIKYEKINKNWLLVLYLIKCLNATNYSIKIGRIIFQKICYLLQRSGTDLGLNFERGVYGPYSPDIKKMITILANNNLMYEKECGKMIEVIVDDDFEIEKDEYSEFDQKNVNKIYSLFKRIKATEQVELVTTILFAFDQLSLSNSKVDENQLLEYIVGWKKRLDNKESEFQIREFARYLTLNEFINLDYSQGVKELFL